MPKKIVSDMIVSKKSIRQIPISTEKKTITRDVTDDQERFKIPKVKRNRRPLNPKFAIWLIAVIALLALFFGVSLIFSSATLVITPRAEKIVFTNDTYQAKKNSPSSTVGLSFEVLSLTKADSVAVSATEEKVANQKASGTIVIYNNYSSSPQRLINNTRFEAGNGKIYRISNSVDVPGTKMVNGKIMPGSVEAKVFADQPGDTYNLKLADLDGDFKIPGFKGSPRYDSFYARLKTDITGGFIGLQKIVGDSVRQTAEAALKASLKEELLKELYAVKPENYLIFPNSYSIDYVSLPDTTDAQNKVKINLEGNLNSLVFNGSKLAGYLATKKITDFDGLSTVFVFNDELTVAINGQDSLNLWKNELIDLKLNGTALIKWSYDGEQIRKDLAGRAAADLQKILAKYKDQVESIEVSFRPIWTRYFPDNIDRINLQELAL